MKIPNITAKTREIIFLKAQGKCVDCGLICCGGWKIWKPSVKHFQLNGTHEIHHIIPVHKEGKTIIKNLILLCKKCHLKRHTKLKPMICKYCGKEFEPNYRVKAIKKFCSHTCRQKYWLIKRSEERANAPKKDTYRIHNIEALKTEFKEEDYKQNFKDYCVSCGKPIDMDWGHYVAYGNY